MSKFQERLLEERNKQKLTQCQVAKYLSITQPSYIRYENGTSEPSIDTLIRLANLFDVSIDYLVGRTEY